MKKTIITAALAIAAIGVFAQSVQERLTASGKKCQFLALQ